MNLKISFKIAWLTGLAYSTFGSRWRSDWLKCKSKSSCAPSSTRLHLIQGLASLITSGLACGALGQGWFTLDSSGLTNGVDALIPGDRYTGVYGVDVFYLSPADSAVMDALNHEEDAVSAYGLLESSGFWLWYTYTGQTMTNGVVSLGTCRLPFLDPPGSTIMLALVLWSGSDPSFLFAEENVFSFLGLIVFAQPTTDYTEVHPKSPPPLAWDVNQDVLLNPPLGFWPFVAGGPQDATAVLGGTAAFTVVVTSKTPIDYQWRFNGTTIPPTTYTSQVSTNAQFPYLTTYSLILTNIQSTNAGQYSFFFTAGQYGLVGLWNSSNAVLTVTSPPPNLSIGVANQGATLSWPFWATNYVLETTSSLGAGASWSTVSNTAAAFGTTFVATNATHAASAFYRLHSL